jgi:hypothetical protein
MINLAFNDLDPMQAAALLTAYQNTKAAQNVLPFPVQTSQPAPAMEPPVAAPAAPEPAPAAIVPTKPAPAYTYDDLAHAAAPLMDAGKTPELQALLRSFGVQALTQLPKERYGEFATSLRGMGARL